MTTTLTTDGKRLADALVKDSPEIKAFRAAALDMIQSLRHAAACNFTPEYSGAVGEARCKTFYEAYEAVRTLPVPPTAATLFAARDGEGARKFAEETWGATWADAEWDSLLEFAALASPQPEAKGPVAAGVEEPKEKNADYDLVAEWLDWNRTRASHTYIADSASIHCLRKLIEEKVGLSVSDALASTTLPAEAKTPDARVGLCEALEALKALADDYSWSGNHLRGGYAESHPLTVARSVLARAALTPTGSAGEDDTVVRKIARHFIGRWDQYLASDRNHECAHRFLVDCGGWVRWEDLRLALAPQPPKAETPAGVGDVRITSANGKHWRLEGPGWTMQPIGQVTAGEARDICERTLAALSTAPAARPGDEVEREALALITDEAGRYTCFRSGDPKAPDSSMLTVSVPLGLARKLDASLPRVLAAAPAADGGRA